MNETVEAWLDAIRDLLEPTGLRFQLNRGATQEEIEDYVGGAKSALGIDLDPSYIAWLSAADGEAIASPGLFFGLQALSIQEGFLVYKDLKSGQSFEREQARSRTPGAIQAAWFNKRWLPIAQDFGGSYLALDYDPGPNGVRGQVITMGTEEEVQSVVAPSFDAFLVDLTGLLRSGNFRVLNRGLALADPPVAHFLDRYVPELAERARKRARDSPPDTRIELVPERSMRIDLNEGGLGNPEPDLAKVELVVLAIRDGEIFEQWKCEDSKGFSKSGSVGVEPNKIKEVFDRRLEKIRALGFYPAEVEKEA